MIYLLISILCSVTVGVLLKLAKRYQINLEQAVTWNYLATIILSLFFFKPQLTVANFSQINPVFVLLGLLLPTVFVILGTAVKHAGLARTDIAQRLSLLISLVAASVIFHENFDRFKETGLALGIVAIVLVMYRKSTNTNKGSWFFLLLVFLGFGCIDTLFKMVAQASLPYTTSLSLIFGISFVISLLYTTYKSAQNKVKFQFINFICGCILGIFNFGNILCYLKAHQAMASNPSTVFAAMNLGVITLGSLIGVVIFKEKLNTYNYIGLSIAMAAIVLITLSKIYAV